MKPTQHTIPHLRLKSGLIFVLKKHFTDTLFTPIEGKTAGGFFTLHTSKKHGTKAVRFYRPNGDLFAIILSNGTEASARSAWIHDGRAMNLFGMTEKDDAALGLSGMSYIQRNEESVAIVESAHSLE
jgi:hypothetical protein